MRGREQRNWIDTLLVGVASIAAVYSGGQAVGSDIVSVFAVSLVLLGTVLSSLVAWRYRESRFLKIDGFLFLAFGIGAFLGSRYLNLIFDEDTFPRELLPSSWLIWLLIFGSFVLWRDTTLLFQAIPALALFGFVGCYDTFRPVVLYFFLYLVCVATLFARAHARDMAERAERSGYFGTDVAALKAGRGLTVALRKGPWRWVAGPEWALGSALAIVALSLLGAPAIRRGVKPISGFAQVAGPRPNPQGSQSSATAGGSTTAQTQTRISQGPVRLRNTPAFDVTGSRGYYFRTDSFDSYSRAGWNKRWDWLNREGVAVSPSRIRSSRRPRLAARRDNVYILPNEEYRSNLRNVGRLPGKSARGRVGYLMRISARSETVAIPVPGEFLKFGETPPQTRFDRGESVTLARPSAYEELPVFFSPPLDANPDARSGRGPENPSEDAVRDPALDSGATPPRLAEFARRAASKGPDGARAERLRAAIAKRIAYNINASATPEGTDPVERALFDTEEGYCDVFASAMVLGARAIGIPARYAVGYLADPRYLAPDGRLTILDSDAHAWAELYFEDLGWVPYDATAGARVVPNGGRRDGDDSIPWYRQPWLATAVNVAIGVLIVVAAVALLWPKRRDARAAIRARDESLERFVRSLARTVRRDRRLDESIVGYVAEIAPRLGPTAESASSLAVDFERQLYGPMPPDSSTNADLSRRVQALRRELKSVPKPR